jgi:hypothetical protein
LDHTSGYARAPVENAPADIQNSPQSQARRARWLLVCGAVAGLALASASILEPAPISTTAKQIDVAAWVNRTVITEAKYQRALAALDQDTREPLSEADRQHVLDRLIDEELLMQRAITLGLDRSNPVVRNTLVSAMIEIIVSGVDQHEPEEREIESFYAENREFFSRSDRYWVRQLRFPFTASPGSAGDANGRSRTEAQETASGAAERLRAGERIAVVARALGGASVVPLPDGYLPASKLREYIGPTPAQHATTMRSGEVSAPIEAGSAWTVLQMVERITSEPLPLAEVRSQVLSEMRRRSGDASLRAYLAELRDDAMIEVPER